MLAEADPLARCRARAEILYQAGDPGAALEAIEEGLRLAPGDLELLHRGVSAALWLRDVGRSDALLRDLQAALGRAELAPEHRGAWEAGVRSFQERSQLLHGNELVRERFLARARVTALGLLGLACLFLLALAPRAQGRSSSPDSKIGSSSVGRARS
jgi:tetratricopeptide (TPR) repeat protein